MNPLRWRKMTWLILLFTGAMVFLLVVGVVASAFNCTDRAAGTQDRELCEAGTFLGASVWVAALFCVWFLGFIVLSIIWFMTRPARRMCPSCGREAREGERFCRQCGYRFAMGVTRSL